MFLAFGGKPIRTTRNRLDTSRNKTIGLGSFLNRCYWSSVGVFIGLAAAFAATHFVENMLFELDPNDSLTIALALLFMLIVAALAWWIPARRAAKVDPMTALRFE
jgi:ABC-type lipoprotein release transport system permease subunit